MFRDGMRLRTINGLFKHIINHKILFVLGIVLGGSGIWAVEARHFVKARNAKIIQDTASANSPKKGVPTILNKPMTLEESAIAQVAYMINCRGCHGVDRMGASAPSLYMLNKRVTFKEFITIVDAGSSQMPGFPLLDRKTRIALYKYLSEIPVETTDQQPGKKTRENQ